jgi:hypothetical protein
VLSLSLYIKKKLEAFNERYDQYYRGDLSREREREECNVYTVYQLRKWSICFKYNKKRGQNSSYNITFNKEKKKVNLKNYIEK